MEEARANIGIVRSFLYTQINFNERSRWAEEATGQVISPDRRSRLLHCRAIATLKPLVRRNLAIGVLSGLARRGRDGQFMDIEAKG
jgi:hypothetical protein